MTMTMSLLIWIDLDSTALRTLESPREYLLISASWNVAADIVAEA